MELITRISEFLEQNPDMDVHQTHECLLHMDLRQNELPVFVRIGDGPNGEVNWYTRGTDHQTDETRPGISYKRIQEGAEGIEGYIITFQSPVSPLNAGEIAQASLKGDTRAGRYGGHAWANLRASLKAWEKPLMDEGSLPQGHYHLHHERNMKENNAGFMIKWRDPSAYDNHDARVSHQWLVSQVGFFGQYSSYQEAMCGPADHPEAKSDTPLMHIGVHEIEVYHGHLPRLGLETPQKQDTFLEKVIDAVYQLPIISQHKERVLAGSR